MNVAGIRQWSQNVEVAANPSQRITVYDVSYDAVANPIPAGGNIFIDAYAPEGYIGFVNNVYFSMLNPAGAGATSGTIEAEFRVGETGASVTTMYGRADFDETLSYNGGKWGLKDADPAYPAYQPSDMAASVLLQQMAFDADSPVRIRIDNKTDVAYNRLIQIRYWVQEVRIGS